LQTSRTTSTDHAHRLTAWDRIDEPPRYLSPALFVKRFMAW